MKAPPPYEPASRDERAALAPSVGDPRTWPVSSWPDPQPLPEGLAPVAPFDYAMLPDRLRPWVFLDALCTIARDTGMHIHLVAHSRKARDETQAPGKMDVKGSGSITDQVDNVVIWWRNKAKENAIQAGEPSDPSKPDALMLIDKQRNGEFEGKVAFWFDPESMQYLEHAGQHPRDMANPTLWAP